MYQPKNKGQASSKLWKMAMIVTVLAAAAACSGGDSGNAGNAGNSGASDKKTEEAVPPVATSPKPVELAVLDANGALTLDSFMRSHGQYIQKKYPHISFKVLEGGGAKVPDYATAKEPVDLISSNANGYGTASMYGYGGYDLTPLAQKHKFDLSKIDASLLDVLRKINDGKLPGLPTGMNYQVMFYSKNVFDKFGEPYPTDGMTWEQVYEKARKLTRQEGGIQYAGFSIWDHSRIFAVNQFGQELLDPKTGKAVFNSASSKLPRLFEQMVKFAEIPGNEYAINDAAVARDAFTKEGRVAMMVGLRTNPSSFPISGDWDVVKYPSFSDLPGVGSAAEPSYLSISSTSKHAEDTFLALSALFETTVQKEKVRAGNYPIVPYSGWEADYYAENDLYKGKNIKGLIVSKFPPAITLGPEPSIVNTEIVTSFREAAKKEKDMNTALREAEERSNKKIEESRAMKK